MKSLILFLIGIFTVFIETFFTNFISGFLSVDLLLIFVVFISLYFDRHYSLVIVGLLGILSDFLTSGIIGVNAALYLAISYFISSVEKSIFKDKRSIVCALVFISSMGFSFISCIVSAIFFVMNPIFIFLLKSIILIPALNTVVAFFAYTVFEDSLIRLREEK